MLYTILNISFPPPELYQILIPKRESAVTSNNVMPISIAEQIRQLSAGLDAVTTELQKQVRQRHGALLSQASHAGKLSVALDAVCGHMDRLRSFSDRLRAQIHAPLAVAQQQTHVLARLHDASHLLRQTGRFLQLRRQLQAATVMKNVAAQARVLHELEPLAANAALAGVELLRVERAAVLAARQRMNAKTNNDLLTGLRTGNESLVVQTLVILGSLQTQEVCVANLLDTFENDIRQAIQECFAGKSTTKTDSVRKLKVSSADSKRAPGKTPTLVTSQHFRTKMWQSIAWLFDDEIHKLCAQIVLLQQCLHQAGGSTGAMAEESGGVAATIAAMDDVEQRFWRRLERLLQQSFGECAIHVRQCLQQELPKLLAAARGLQARFGKKFAFDEAVFQPLEAGYLEQCAVNLKAPLVGTDSASDERIVDELVRAAAQELSAAMVDGRLCMMVANVFNACGREFLIRCSGLVKLGTDSKQVIGEGFLIKRQKN